MKAENQDKSAWVQVGVYTGLAVMLPAAAFIGYALGYLADRHLHTGRLWQIVGLLIGIAAGMIELIRTVTRDSS